MEEKKETPVSLLDAILVLIVTLGLFLFVGGITFIALGLGAAIIFPQFVLLIVPLAYLWFKHVDIKSYMGIHLKPKLIVLGISFAFVLLLINIILGATLTSIFGVSEAVEEANALIVSLSQSPGGLALILIGLSFAGVSEEFLFRGFLQNSLTRKLSFIPALLISSLAFGLMHFDPQLVYIISTFAAGLFLGYIFHRWRSYVVSATAHSVMNIIVLVILILTI
jgi:membrane protease YdiL (CAAX protease family)